MSNVLLVHCEKEEMDRFARYLDDIYNVLPVTVRTEQQLWTLLDTQPIQVLIINAGPGWQKEGMTICSRLKSMPRYTHLITILLIPAGSREARICCLESGADGWIEQPLSRDYLRAQLRNLVASRRRLKNYFSQSLLFNRDPMTRTRDNHSFQSRLNNIIIDNLPDTGLNVDVLARLMNISRPTLYRKVKCISDRTPNELVNLIRLNKAAELLSAGEYKVHEIAQLVGFHSRSNFGKAFVKHFRVTPMEYRGGARRR